MSIIALIPAYNEPLVGLTVDSILRQTHSVTAVIVVTNNCTDGGETARIAEAHGATVVDLGIVEGQKAGALNIGLSLIQALIPSTEFVLQMDADTILEEHFVENTVKAMHANGHIGGLGASFIGQDKLGKGLIGQFLVWGQHQEFARYQATQLTTQTSVMSGTASLLRVKALDQLRLRRGFVWSETCIVEDYETTKALQALGWLCMTDPTFVAYTDVMTTWSDLVRQRKRWQRGTLEVIFRDYKGQACIRIDKWRQFMAHAMILPHLGSYGFLLVMSIMWHGLQPAPLVGSWVVLGIYNFWSARRAGWGKALVAGFLVPLELYNFVRYYWLWKSWRLYRLSKEQAW